MPSVEKLLVIRHREIVPYYELEFIASSIAQEVLPGQFVNIRVSTAWTPPEEAVQHL